MGILRLRPEALVGFRGLVARIVLGGNDDDELFGGRGCEAWRERGAWREFAEVVRTSRSCSGAWLETKTIGAAWREARRLS